MAGHTPGQWEYLKMYLGNQKDRRSGFVVNGPEKQPSDKNPIPIRICDLRCSPESPYSMTEANAKLIAAAPELLEVAKKIIVDMDVLLSEYDEPETLEYRTFDRVAKMCKEIVTKATGE